jgi:hypothetical protein
MLFWILFILAVLVLIFGFVVFVGAPYLPTTKKQVKTALDLLDLEPGETLLELGSGDGRVMRAAAERGLKVVGIELNPVLVVISWFVTLKYRSQVRIIWGSYWGAPWPRADAVFTFMIGRYMKRLDERIEFWRTKPTKLASFAFAIPGREPAKTKNGVHLYEYK